MGPLSTRLWSKGRPVCAAGGGALPLTGRPEALECRVSDALKPTSHSHLLFPAMMTFP